MGGNEAGKRITEITTDNGPDGDLDWDPIFLGEKSGAVATPRDGTGNDDNVEPW